MDLQIFAAQMKKEKEKSLKIAYVGKCLEN